MIEQALTRRNCSLKVKVTVKGLISLGLAALAVVLPQLVHLALGQAGGVQWLVSFLLTSAWGEAMPAVGRLPFMMAELAVFAAVSGAFAKKISSNAWMAFPAVLLAQVAGRSTFLLLVVIFRQFVSFTPELIWSQIRAGLLGMVLQAVVVPFLVMGLRALLERSRHD